MRSGGLHMTIELQSDSQMPTPDDDRPASGAHVRIQPKTESASSSCISADQTAALSIRAENVLKELAVELTGEIPPHGGWIPSDLLLQRLTYKHLSTARNCGPQTITEIIKWSRVRGTIIQRPFNAGRSPSAIWQDIIAKFSADEISKAEIAEALEHSVRRRNTRIPIAVQKMLLQLMRSSDE